MGRRSKRRGAGRLPPSADWTATAAVESHGALPVQQVPSEDAIDQSMTLQALRGHEGTILAATRVHEDALSRLQTLYKRVRAKMYRDHKAAVIAQDNSALTQFQVTQQR